MHMHSSTRQQGLALITVLMIFSLASLLAVGMQMRQKMDVAQASATLAIGQAQLIALSAEDFAKAGLTADGKFDAANEEMDNVSELWNSPLFEGIPLGPKESPYQVSISIRDLQGLFNLNSLAANAPSPVMAKQRFKRLLGELQLDTAIADRVADWMNPDSQATYTYQSFEPAYSAAGLPFTHTSELMLIDGMDKKMFETLEPYVAALPIATPLNVNTAPAEVLQAWDDKMDLAGAQSALEQAASAGCEITSRNQTGFKSVDDFWDQEKIQELAVKQPDDDSSSTDPDPAEGWDKADFDVKTQFFSIIIKTEIEDRRVIVESIIKRDMGDNGFVGVIYRDFSRKDQDASRLKIKPC